MFKTTDKWAWGCICEEKTRFQEEETEASGSVGKGRAEEQSVWLECRIAHTHNFKTQFWVRWQA